MASCTVVRVYRASTAASPLPSARAGNARYLVDCSGSSRNDTRPLAGNQPSPTAKPHKSSTPSRKLGMPSAPSNSQLDRGGERQLDELAHRHAGSNGNAEVAPDQVPDPPAVLHGDRV